MAAARGIIHGSLNNWLVAFTPSRLLKNEQICA
jgi:hypothetical protein